MAALARYDRTQSAVDRAALRELAAERRQGRERLAAEVLATMRKLGRAYVIEVAEAVDHRSRWARVKACLVRMEEVGYLTSDLVPAAECDGNSGGPGRRYFSVRVGGIAVLARQRAEARRKS